MCYFDSDGEFIFFSLEFSAYSLEFQTDELGMKVFNFGEIILSSGLSLLGPFVQASASAWSPSLFFEFNNITVEMKTDLLAFGAHAKLTPTKVDMGIAIGVGFYISIQLLEE